jgi:hypothetical protein
MGRSIGIHKETWSISLSGLSLHQYGSTRNRIGNLLITDIEVCFFCLLLLVSLVADMYSTQTLTGFWYTLRFCRDDKKYGKMTRKTIRDSLGHKDIWGIETSLQTTFFLRSTWWTMQKFLLSFLPSNKRSSLITFLHFLDSPSDIVEFSISHNFHWRFVRLFHCKFYCQHFYEFSQCAQLGWVDVLIRKRHHRNSRTDFTQN